MQRSNGKRTIWQVTALLAFLSPLAAASGIPSAPIVLNVDATEVSRRIIHVKLLIPVTPGPLTLLYPKWIPGEHTPTGPIADLTGLMVSSGGRLIMWQRDPVDMYAFHCNVPAGSDSVQVELDYLSPGLGEGGVSGDAIGTAQLAVINWNRVLVYPQGLTAGKLTYAARLRLPRGWKYGTALPVAEETPEEVEFAPVSLYRLVDSPVIAGAYFRAVELNSRDDRRHVVDIAGESAAALTITPAWVGNLNQLVDETGSLFGGRHYERYHFLLALSDQLPDEGLEHHESSDNRVGEHTLTDPTLTRGLARLLPHEFVHSWNGKYRRPAGLDTPDYQAPMKDDLLWVYEGLTRYLDGVLTVRSGFWAPEYYREYLAYVAADITSRTGRKWRPLSDTAVAAPVLHGARDQWNSWRRSIGDYYDESLMIWLESESLIRQQTPGKSLDDFCRGFFGGPSGPPTVVPYSLDDVVVALSALAPLDWHSFFAERVYSIKADAPLGGLERVGWKLAYSDIPNEYLTDRKDIEKTINAVFSVGLLLNEDGTVRDVIQGLPAERAGIAPGMKLVAVNGRRWSPTVFHEALQGTKNGSAPLELIVENADFYKTYQLDYRQGEKYPHLVRDPMQPDLLDEILRPRLVRVRHRL